MQKHFLSLLFVSFCLLVSYTVEAGGPIVVNDQGVAATWDIPTSIPYQPESGSCATFGNSEMLIKIEENVAHWTDISTILLGFSQVTGQLGLVDSSNYEDYIALTETDPPAFDGLNPVIFDDDGEIIGALFGSSNKFFVLGFAGPDRFSDDRATIADGQALFNCFCLADNPTDTEDECASIGVTFSEDDLNFTMMHEFGHFLNFDHTQVNQGLVLSGCSTSTEGDCDDIPAMFPQSVDPADQITPQRDDIVAALTLYGDSSLASSFCTITGALEDKDGWELRCADVQATTDDVADTIAIVSGAFAPAEDLDEDSFTDGENECLSDCGVFTLRGLDPNKDYTITVKPIDPAWIGSSSVGPCGTGQPTGVVAEEIATVTSCVAGSTTSLGTIKTESDLDEEEEDETVTECGENKNFDKCSSLIDCSLTKGENPGTSGVLLILLGLYGGVMICLRWQLRDSRKP